MGSSVGEVKALTCDSDSVATRKEQDGSPTAPPCFPVTVSLGLGLSFCFLKTETERKGVDCDKNGYSVLGAWSSLFEVSRNFSFKHWQKLPLEASTWPREQPSPASPLCQVA